MFRKFRAKILIVTFFIAVGVFSFLQLNKGKSLHRQSADASSLLTKHDSIQLPFHDSHTALPSTIDKLSKVNEIRELIHDMNSQQVVHNLEKFGPPPNQGTVAVVQVHSRVGFLKQLLESLRKARGIERVTLVISMDKYDADLMELINPIEFCRFITIFFPFSMQLYPDSFPGEDPDDCPRDMPQSEALKVKCNNAEFPDMYKHYREVKFVQIKHHWLWKLHHVFNGLQPLADTDSTVLLLEEDYYVLPDVFHMMKLSLELMKTSCPGCMAISLGNYETTTDYSVESADVLHRTWVSSKNNIGMVITKSFYNAIVRCNEDFCSYDDYNWDWTLQGIAPSCMGGSLSGLFLSAARVLHLGSCDGVHQRAGRKDCDPKRLAEKATAKVADADLFPNEIAVKSKMVRPSAMPFMNGGWGDHRDHQLCRGYYNLSKNVARVLKEDQLKQR